DGVGNKTDRAIGKGHIHATRVFAAGAEPVWPVIGIRTYGVRRTRDVKACANRPGPISAHAHIRNKGTLSDQVRIAGTVGNAGKSSLTLVAPTREHAIPGDPGIALRWRILGNTAPLPGGGRIDVVAPAKGGAHHAFIARQAADQVVHVNVEAVAIGRNVIRL